MMWGTKMYPIFKILMFQSSAAANSADRSATFGRRTVHDRR